MATEEVSVNGNVADFVEDAAANGNTTAEEQEPEPVVRSLYLVRMPKPTVNEDGMKKLQVEFQAHVAKLKAQNAKLQAKRDEVRGYRRQMSEARGLKETSEPEYQEKLARIKQLKELRNSFTSKIQDIKANIQGLDCKSEEELDDKIRELENRIAHEGMTLREEKQVVQLISKLNGQRAKIREYDTHKSALADLESESSKIKAIINDMDSEFSVIKIERDAANKIVQDIYTKLQKASKELQELESEQAELVAAKDEVVRALDQYREEANNTMKDWRENRRFSLQIRDMVAAGEAEQARGMVAEQVEAMVARLTSDPAFRKEYQQLWSEQRRYAVSECLPGSSIIAQQEAKQAAAAAKGAGKGGKGAAKAAVYEPRGAEKAKDIIASIMAEVSRESAAREAGRPIPSGHRDSDSGDADDEQPVAQTAAKKAEPYKPPAAAAAPKAEAAKLVADPAAAAMQAFNFKVDLPKVEDEQFVPPVIKAEESAADAAAKRAAMLEEQRRKAEEAEERKRKRAEAAERKRIQAAETAKRLEQERRERDAAARAAAAESKAAAEAARLERRQVKQSAATDSANDSAARPSEVDRVKLAAAKRPKVKPTLLQQVVQYCQQNQGLVVFVAFVLIMIVLIYMYARS